MKNPNETDVIGARMIEKDLKTLLERMTPSLRNESRMNLRPRSILPRQSSSLTTCEFARKNRRDNHKSRNGVAHRFWL
jgi:hypothetical protein